MPPRPMWDVADQGVRLKAARKERQESLRRLSRAILVAAGADAETPAIADIAAARNPNAYDLPIAALSPTSVLDLLRDHAGEVLDAWKEAGCPTLPTALEQVRRTAETTALRIGDYRRRQDQLVEAMWRASAAGNPARAIATMAGTSYRATRRHVNALDDWTAITQALADLDTEQRDGGPDRTFAHFGTVFWARNLQKSSDVHRRMQQALATVHWQIQPSYDFPHYWGQWVPLQ
ncbi:hypothetical protein AB0C84_35795 [Actinomadura sp. NPDC048955]|uniref:hypothetical protein n=1 Tax=Actinomadura sp. NPDC048955 TaxID=3158228 RepID=UPI0033E5A7E3